MIVVTVQLISANGPSRDKELARMTISNIGGTDERGEYAVKTFRGRCKAALDKFVLNRQGSVSDYPRNDIHVWHLVAEALKSVNYHRRPK